jgi:O-antigen ligase
VGDWVPVVFGLPVLKIAFVLAVMYVNRVSIAYGPVRVLALPVARLAIAFLTLSIVSVLFSVYKSQTLASSYLSAIYLVSFVMLVKTTQSRRDVERLLIGLAVAGSALAIGVLATSHGQRAHINAKFDPNDLGYSLVTLLPIVLALRGTASGWRRFLMTSLSLVMCMAVLLTASRGAVVGLITVLLAVSAFPLDLDRHGALRKRSLAAVLTTLALVAGLGAVMFRVLPENSQERILSLTHPGDDYNASTTLNTSRRVIWARDFRLALERPIGYGMGTATAVDGLYGHGAYRAVHNSVIQAFLELGVLGLYLYLASYYVTWRELGRISGARSRDGPEGDGARAALYARALRVALLGNFVAGFFLSQAYSAPLWMMLAICCVFIRFTTPGDGATTSSPSGPGRRWRRARQGA